MTTVTDIEYQADGRRMIGRLAVPGGEGQRPAILIAHEGPGLDEHQRNRADQLAELGYVAFALDYQGGGVSMTDREAMMGRLDQLWHDSERTRDLAGAGLNILLDQPRVDPTKVAAIGYCFGGHLVLELARAGTDLAVVVGFHPRLVTPRPLDAANITAKVLVCVGTEDPLISVGERLMFEEQMRAAGVDWGMNLYGGAQHTSHIPGSTGSGSRGCDSIQSPQRGHGGPCSTCSTRRFADVAAALAPNLLLTWAPVRHRGS